MSTPRDDALPPGRPSKHIALLGGTGRLGRRVLAEALKRGHTVTALVRPGSHLRERRRLGVVRGEATKDLDAMRRTVRGADAVVSALGSPKPLRGLRKSRVISESTAIVVPAMEAEGVGRVVWTSALGAGPTHRDLPALLRLPYRVALGPAFRDKEDAEAMLTETTLGWTLVHPVVLTDDEGVGAYEAEERLRLHGVPKVSRADVARFILDEVERPRFLRRRAEVTRPPRSRRRGHHKDAGEP